MPPLHWPWLVWVRDDQPYTFSMVTQEGEPLDLRAYVWGLRIECERNVWNFRTDDVSGPLVLLDQDDPLTVGQITITFSLEHQKSFLTNSFPKYDLYRLDGTTRLPCLYGYVQASGWTKPE